MDLDPTEQQALCRDYPRGCLPPADVGLNRARWAEAQFIQGLRTEPCRVCSLSRFPQELDGGKCIDRSECR